MKTNARRYRYRSPVERAAGRARTARRYAEDARRCAETAASSREARVEADAARYWLIRAGQASADALRACRKRGHRADECALAERAERDYAAARHALVNAEWYASEWTPERAEAARAVKIENERTKGTGKP